jgi:hypothetical protein
MDAAGATFGGCVGRGSRMNEQYVERLVAPARSSAPDRPEAALPGTTPSRGWERADRFLLLSMVLIAQLSWLATLGYLAFRFL